MSTTVAGLTSAVVAVSPDANVAEWNAFAALYDEYRVHGGRVKFWVSSQTLNPTASGGLGVDNMFVMGWDPAGAASLASVREGCELAQHALFAPSLVLGDSTSLGAERFGYVLQGGKPLEFHWRTGKARALVVQSGLLSYTPGAWKSIEAAGSNNPDGSIKGFGQFASTGGVRTVISGVVYLDIEFRSRR